MGKDSATTRQLTDSKLRQGSYENGKVEVQDFFIFQGLNLFPISYNTTFKSALFQPEAVKWKGALDFFDSDTGDKNQDYCKNWIE